MFNPNADDWFRWDAAVKALRSKHRKYTRDQWDAMKSGALDNCIDVAADEDPMGCAIETLRMYAAGELDAPY